MSFVSFEFLFFLPIVLIGYFLIHYEKRWIWLLLASYIFYGFHNPAYIILLLLSTTIDFITGLRIYETKDKSLKKKWLRLSIFTNVGLLIFFKYYNFFSAELNSLFQLLSIPFSITEHHFLLPLGISFYTFQTMSYTIDVYRGYLRPETHFGKFALFVCFFPQLIAGPIEKAKDLLGQFHFQYKFDYKRVVEGLQLILWGLFKKLVIADWMAVYANEVFDVSNNHEGLVILIATFLFFIQVYCDFSGYCDIAIGIGRILGIKLSQNFGNFIYFTSVKNMWAGWHITISNWFRDYVLFPLSQVKREPWFAHFSLFLTFIISGLWHGAGWGFIVWGMMHGLLVVTDYLTKAKRSALSNVLGLNQYPILLNTASVTISFLFVVLPTIFFKCPTITEAVILLQKMFNDYYISLHQEIGRFNQVFIVLLIILVISFHLSLKEKHFYEYLAEKSSGFRWAFYIISLNLILYARPPVSGEFIYFEF